MVGFLASSCPRLLRSAARIAPAALAIGLAVLGSTSTAGAESHVPAVPAVPPGATAAEACTLAFGRDAFDSVPSEGLVTPGDPLPVDVTWGTGWKLGQILDVLSCTAVDGVISEELSVRRRAPEPDGLLSLDVRVPEDATGTAVCQWAIVIGESPAGAPRAERNDPSCYAVAPTAAATTEEPVPAAPSDGRETDPSRDAGASPGERPSPQAAPLTPEAPPAPTPESPPTALARTGTTERVLLLAAGVALVLGGLGLAVSRPGGLPSR